MAKRKILDDPRYCGDGFFDVDKFNATHPDGVFTGGPLGIDESRITKIPKRKYTKRKVTEPAVVNHKSLIAKTEFQKLGAKQLATMKLLAADYIILRRIRGLRQERITLVRREATNENPIALSVYVWQTLLNRDFLLEQVYSKEQFVTSYQLKPRILERFKLAFNF